ncbi:T9SS type A sorting domain-containing protein [Neolewinella lacunae]|uniref:T9SS type A sorting domain-containing protein n=1 Tax=Neolewinella lacunae TaxID=1517758 RepID=A0A923PIP0_9BACT|nr:T9SS type A sorting domain-containing protein [Neolewinella lacunae]MBC6993305.1 T9SS type A sorting domain-containing protein [Neolewinella lacunae]MDN3636854.1 T9SS type A sorting domain-containing protein [Neolewinella lacunae]
MQQTLSRSLFFAAFLLLAATLVGQQRVQLRVPNVVAIGNEIMCVPVIADSFPAIASVQFSVAWDPREVDFVELRYGANPLELNAARVAMPEPDNVVVAFLTDDLTGITLPAGTTIMELCFNGVNASGSTPITFSGFREPEFVQENTITSFPFDTIPGSLNFGPDLATTVLPGDTDNNFQVDHRDLLNIGLLHGRTGPARDDDGTVFFPQQGLRWPGELNSGLNHALADADGNGTVGAGDLATVDNFYTQSMTTAFIPAPDASSVVPEAPQLTIESPELNVGEAATLAVSLGDGNDPFAVGYGLAFTVAFSPDEISSSSISVDFSNSFLGNDLLTIARVNELTPGRLEIALSRKDQINTTTPGGEVCRITFTPENPNTSESYTANLSIIPNAFILADQQSAPILGSTVGLMVMGGTSASEPTWGQDLVLYPNPIGEEQLFLGGNLPALSRIRLLETTGRTVRDLSGDLRQINLRGLPGGTYLLELGAAQGVIYRRVVKL